jgi:hypothetical protein
VIIWGKKIVRSHLGYAADFCPVCACARPFALNRVGSAAHLYFIAVGDGDLVGYERACMVCTVVLKANPTQYAEVATRPSAIQDLVKQTFPNLAQAHHERLSLERAIRLDPTMVSDANRQTLIMEPFLLLSVKVSERFENSAFSANTGFLKNEVLPIVARALRRLRPTEAELKAAITHLVQLKEPIGFKIKLVDLAAALQQPASNDAAKATGKMVGQAPVQVGHAAKHRINAGKLMRLLSYLIAVAVLGLSLLTLVPSETKQAPTALWAILAFAGVVGFAVYRASSAVTQGLSWGRTVGSAFGVMLLFGFPFGTALGAYLLWCLGLKWTGADGMALRS